MPMPSFVDTRITLANRANYSVRFLKNDKLNILSGKAFPATTVRTKSVEAEFMEWQIANGVPIAIYKGAMPPTEITINFIDNENNDLYKGIAEWIQSGIIGTKANIINLCARLPNRNEVIIEVSEYASDSKTVTLTTQYAVLAPKDALDKDLGDTSHKQYNLSFKVVGFLQK